MVDVFDWIIFFGFKVNNCLFPNNYNSVLDFQAVAIGTEINFMKNLT